MWVSKTKDYIFIFFKKTSHFAVSQNPAVCLNFADQFLDWIKQVVTVDDAATTFAIEFKPHLQEIHIRCTGHTNVFLTQRFLDGKTQHEIGGQRAMIKE